MPEAAVRRAPRRVCRRLKLRLAEPLHAEADEQAERRADHPRQPAQFGEPPRERHRQEQRGDRAGADQLALVVAARPRRPQIRDRPGSQQGERRRIAAADDRDRVDGGGDEADCFLK